MVKTFGSLVTEKVLKFSFLLTAIFLIGLHHGYLVAQQIPTSASNNHEALKGLKDYYKKYFPIGVAVNLSSLSGADSGLIVTEFNSITAENAMKMGPIHPEENSYYWKDADAIAEFGQRNKMRIRGHNLLWHRQAPHWFFTGPEGKQVSKEVLLKRLKDHIITVVNHYKGKIYAWDVVNEAIDDDSTKFLRDLPFYQIGGEEIITKAFEYAHEADPDALLFYNDYNRKTSKKRSDL